MLLRMSPYYKKFLVCEGPVDSGTSPTSSDVQDLNGVMVCWV